MLVKVDRISCTDDVNFGKVVPVWVNLNMISEAHPYTNKRFDGSRQIDGIQIFVNGINPMVITRDSFDEVLAAANASVLEIEDRAYDRGYHDGVEDAEAGAFDDDDDELTDAEIVSWHGFVDCLQGTLMNNMDKDAPIIPMSELNSDDTDSVYKSILRYCRPQDYLEHVDIRGHSLWVFDVRVETHVTVKMYVGFIVAKGRYSPTAHFIDFDRGALYARANKWASDAKTHLTQ